MLYHEKNLSAIGFSDVYNLISANERTLLEYAMNIPARHVIKIGSNILSTGTN
jgi:hypothetical protein